MNIKILTTIIFLIIYILNLNNCQTLDSIENAAAIDLYYQLHSTNITDPCDDYAEFICEIDESVSNTLTITEMYIYANPVINPLTTDFTVFKNLVTLELGQSISTQQNIMNSLSDFIRINSVIIGNQSQIISNDLVLPSTLSKLYITLMSVPLVSSIFSTGALQFLKIDYVGDGFQYPVSFPETETLNTFYCPLTYFSGPFPSNAGSALSSLTEFRITIYNDNYTKSYVNFNFPTFEAFNSLTDLTISFNNELDYQPFQFSNSIFLSKNLESITIEGRGFKNQGIIDFSSLNPGLKLLLSYGSCGMFTECLNKPCLRVPKKTYLKIVYCFIDIKSTIDFTNVTSIDINTGQTQTLPVDTIDFPNVGYIRLAGGQFTGTIPNEYCKFPYNAMELGGNQLSGDVPSCFSCFGGNIFSIFPNDFNLFNESSPPTSCPTYSIDYTPNTAIKTDGSTVLTIKGKDFAWAYSSDRPGPPALLSPQAMPGPIFKLLVSNTEFTLSFPKGDGANKTFYGEFGVEGTRLYPFDYSYEAPVITGYEFIDILGDWVLIIIGTGFSFIEKNNNVTVNGVLYSLAYDGSFNGINIPDDQGYSSLQPGAPFTVFANVNGQKSNIKTFNYYNKITLTKPTSTLKSIGGSLDLSGSFVTSDKSQVTITINSLPCTTVSASPSTITINYPPLNAGNYELILNIGGYQVVSQVEYIFTPTPSPTQSTTPTPSDSDSDNPSSSSKLSISITIITFSLLLISLIL